MSNGRRRLPAPLRLAVILIGLPLLWVQGPTDPLAPSLVPPAWAAPLNVRLFRGEVGKGVEATLTVHAPLQVVYTVLSDPKPSAEFLPYVVQVAVEKDTAGEQVIKYRARHFGLFDTEYWQGRHLQPPFRVNFWQHKGPFRKVEGQWSLRAVVDGTQLTYRVQVDPGFPVPGPLQNFMLKQGLPALTDAIRRRSESGGTWKKPDYQPS
jgi:ribosome-associated toxin RatA of RatAB toxin-antitoxin module